MLAAPAPELRQFLAVARTRRQDGISRTARRLPDRARQHRQRMRRMPYRGMPRSINRRPPCNTATPASPPSAWPAPRSPPRCPWPGRRRQRRSLQDILAAKKLRVAIDLGVPPYGMKDAALKSTGSDVETARLLAQDLGVELEIVPTTGANRVPFLQTNKADIVISSMSITPERQKVVDFSVPYAAILAVVGAPRSMTLTSAADLANKKVIATRGTTNDAELTKIAPKDAQIIRFDDDATSITAVVSGQADIFATAPALLRTINDKAPARWSPSSSCG